MSEKKVHLSNATAAELKEFASTHLGMQFDGNESVESMRAQISAAWDKPEILVAAGSEPAKPIAKKAGKAGGRDSFIVRIEQQETFDGNEPVPLGCNGKILLVPRGRWCEVPERFRDSLVNAVEHRRDALSGGGLGPVREVPRYPHQIWEGAGDPPEGVLRPGASA